MLADHTYRQNLPLVSGETEAHFPIPSFEVIAKFAHLTTQPDVEKGIPVGDLVICGTGIVDAAEPNPLRHGDWDSVNNQSRIGDGERIKRILKRHTDAYASAWGLEWIEKPHSCSGGFKK